MRDTDLVLIGAGHSNIQVARMLAMSGERRIRLTVVDPQPAAWYSGMLPACLAGLYRPQQLQIELRPFLRWAGARYLPVPAIGLDRERKRIHLDGRPDLAYDLCAIDIGSSARTSGIPGVAEYAVATRPINRLIPRVEAVEARLGSDRRDPTQPVRVVVVGGGAAGFELACAMRSRWQVRFGAVAVTLIDAHPDILRERSWLARRLGGRVLDQLAIATRLGHQVARIEADAVVLDDGERVAHDLVLWAGGAAPPALAAEFDLPRDEDGYLLVRDTLQSVADDDVFAAGDCARIAGRDRLPRAGVYAVRQGPVLATNLRARARREVLIPYRPQRRFLALLMTGDGRAIADRGPLAAAGAWAWHWKDAIDRRWMERFDPRSLPPMVMSTEMDEEEAAAPMRCAGCGGKLGALALAEALDDGEDGPSPTIRSTAHDRILVGIGGDAATVRIPEGRALVTTVDHFRAFFDDPWLMGRIAVLHACSDLWVAGAEADTLLAQVTLGYASERLQIRDLRSLMAGIRHQAAAHGIALIGGHSDEGAELAIGITANGLIDPEDARAKAGFRVGDALILSKALGTGIILAADMQSRASSAEVEAAIAAMLRPNATTAAILRAHDLSAMTDVTGFGLAGHLAECCEAADLAAEIEYSAVPLLPGVERCIAAGIGSTLLPHNQARVDPLWRDQPTPAQAAWLCDPQTAGGVLAGIASADAEATVADLRANGDHEAAIIGRVVAGPPGLSLRSATRR